jgi:uncharacterized protein YyaL (SSP411 family)
MLTDQALLARAYLHAWQSAGNPEHLQVASETIEYVLRDLADPAGGLCSSQDADAAGAEGGHATFTPGQVREALSGAGRPDLVDTALHWYGVTDGGNWDGVSVLHRPRGAPLHRPPDVEEARHLLADYRRSRPGPAIDDKVLTEWNAMFASTLAEAAAATGNDRWAARAEEIVAFLFDQLRRPSDGAWLRSWQGGRARHRAMAADLAWVVDACTRLGELTGRARWTQRAVEVGDRLLADHWDAPPEGTGGFFTTANDAESLIVRAKDLFDGATPSANAVAAGALLRLGALTGEARFSDAGRAIIELAEPFLNDQPVAVASMAAAAGLIDQRVELVVAGDRPDLLSVARRRWLPSAVLAWGERTASPLWAGRTDGWAYVCRGFACRLPAGDPSSFAARLDEVEGPMADRGNPGP